METAASPTKLARISPQMHSNENRIIDVRRFLITHGLFNPNPDRSRRAPMKIEHDNDAVRKICAKVEAETGVNFDGIFHHCLAVRDAEHVRRVRLDSERTRAAFIRKYTCTCCNTYEPTTKRRDPGVTGDDRLSKARAAALCDPCWWAILQLAAESGKKTHAAASYFAAL